jgi:four helix bundle protein
MSDFNDVKVWQKSLEIRKTVLQLVEGLPGEGRFNLSGQLVTAARSITANLTEVYGRFHGQDKVRFCRRSGDSLLELFDHLEEALQEGHISSKQHATLIRRGGELLSLLGVYAKRLESRERS